MCVLYVSVPLFPSVMAYVYATLKKQAHDTCDTQLESQFLTYMRRELSRLSRYMVNYILLQYNKEAHMRERSVFHTCALLRPGDSQNLMSTDVTTHRVSPCKAWLVQQIQHAIGQATCGGLHSIR